MFFLNAYTLQIFDIHWEHVQLGFTKADATTWAVKMADWNTLIIKGEANYLVFAFLQPMNWCFFHTQTMLNNVILCH